MTRKNQQMSKEVCMYAYGACVFTGSRRWTVILERGTPDRDSPLHAYSFADVLGTYRSPASILPWPGPITASSRPRGGVLCIPEKTGNVVCGKSCLSYKRLTPMQTAC